MSNNNTLQIKDQVAWCHNCHNYIICEYTIRIKLGIVCIYVISYKYILLYIYTLCIFWMMTFFHYGIYHHL